MDDRKVGLIIRALRRRRGWRQVDVAAAAEVSQTEISLAERGHVDRIPPRTMRKIVGALEARVEYEIRWRGADLDRVVDHRHAAVVDEAVRRLRGLGWIVQLEVTYDHGWSRGSFDLLAFAPRQGALINGEVKSDLGSVEGTLRKHDEKGRLAASIARARYGWEAEHVGRLLILPGASTPRRQVRRYDSIFDAVLPTRGLEVQQWLRRPDRDLAGIWFLSGSTDSAGRRARGGPTRVRLPARALSRACSPLGMGAPRPHWVDRPVGRLPNSSTAAG